MTLARVGLPPGPARVARPVPTVLSGRGRTWQNAIGRCEVADANENVVVADVPETDVELDTQDAQDAAVEQDVVSLKAVEKVAKEANISTADAANATTANAIARLAEHQAQTNGLIMQQNQLLQQNLDALTRAQAGTDISAQRAAQAAEAVEEAIEPVSETSPDASEKPEDIKELPTREVQQQRSKTFYFGKAALRHGKGQ